MPATLRDVAARADVSVKTVSNVVHGRLDRVSPETAERVRASLAALNYRPNLAARHLRNGRTGALALAIPYLTNPYFASLCATVIDAAGEHGYTVLIEHTGGEWKQERLALRGLSRHVIDGVILSPLALDIDDMRAPDAAVPVVLLGERLFEAPYDHVVIDNVAAARMATAHLLSLGRRRIAAIGAPERPQNFTASMRLRGYEEALREAGHEINRALIVPTLPTRLAYTRVDGAQAMRRLLALDRPPDAVFCFNDLLALGAMKVLHLAGYRVPDDVAVVGFDNVEEALFAHPSLTTIAPDERAIARSAVSLLIARIRGTGAAAPQFVQPPFRLIVRGSTGGPEPNPAADEPGSR
jgi:DNA-binding LacI/PurR family transcriptional regulator